MLAFIVLVVPPFYVAITNYLHEREEIKHSDRLNNVNSITICIYFLWSGYDVAHVRCLNSSERIANAFYMFTFYMFNDSVFVIIIWFIGFTYTVTSSDESNC